MKTMTSTDSLQVPTDSLQLEPSVQTADTCMQVAEPSGMKGEPLPYKLESDEAVVGAIFVCFVLILLALQRGPKTILPYLKNAISVKRRPNIFDERTSSSSISTVVLSISTMLASGICLYRYYSSDLMFQQANHILILAAYFVAFSTLIIGKSLLYNFVNWVFFNRDKASLWKENYWELIAASGVVLFPTVLYVTFLDPGTQISDYLLLTILFIFKILLFYKLIRNFFSHLYGVSHLILYFCALEIIPDLLIWKGVEIFNNVFIKI